jgi:molybdopterin converting factor small subunit
MRVKVKLFAGLREHAGWSERELDDVTHVDDVWPALGLGVEPTGLLYAVNKEYAQRDRRLEEGDEVAVIPPVSGGDFRTPRSRRSHAIKRARSRHSSARRVCSHAAGPSRTWSTRRIRRWPNA